MENKDRSIFRKNIGRCLLNRLSDPYATIWEKDFTTRKARELNATDVDHEKQASMEAEISDLLQKSFSFVAAHVVTKEDRLGLEGKIIATVASCEACKPSSNWLGQCSPDKRVRESGLWQVQGLRGTALSEADLGLLSESLVK